MSAAKFETQATLDDALTPHVIRQLPILVILPHSRCNCRCMMCDIWKIRQIREITAADLEPHRTSLRELNVQWIVLSGGEPLMHSDLPPLVQMFRAEGIRTTLLTAGLILEQHADQVARDMDDVIVSIDGPREVHDRIRGVPNAYGRLQRGIYALRERRASMPIHGRCTVQRHNCSHLRSTVIAANELGLTSLSFLAADMTSGPFNHAAPLPEGKIAGVALSAGEAQELEGEIERLVGEFQDEIDSGFIREKPAKLRRLAQHFRAHLGQALPVAPRCNAPWVSAVIESDGAVRPCFFHSSFGNIQSASLTDIMNSEPAVQFRRDLDISNNAICQKCICSLFLEESPSGRLRFGGEKTVQNVRRDQPKLQTLADMPPNNLH